MTFLSSGRSLVLIVTIRIFVSPADGGHNQL
jgi:hypothetical protein